MAHSEDFEFKQNPLSKEGKRRWDDIFKREVKPVNKERGYKKGKGKGK